MVHSRSARSETLHDAQPNAARIVRVERRRGARQPKDGVPREHLWLMCEDGAMGGQVVVHDLSTGGVGIEVNRSALRLIAALRRAQESKETVSVYRSLHDGHQTARVVWGLETKSAAMHFGLELMPLIPRNVRGPVIAKHLV